ncbi:hypothetical protein [Enterococcus mundtii]|uniref:hypothetical protein n=1 Tax=Enterococcus mundtii TaxID=53346 RepID=UPI0020CE1158|nr:hypothetical protein [Enterococcus mundtii]
MDDEWVVAWLQQAYYFRRAVTKKLQSKTICNNLKLNLSLKIITIHQEILKNTDINDNDFIEIWEELMIPTIRYTGNHEK